MDNKDILYKIIIYKEVKKLEIYKKGELIYNQYYLSELEMCKTIILKTHDCHDIEKIEIIYK